MNDILKDYFRSPKKIRLVSYTLEESNEDHCDSLLQKVYFHGKVNDAFDGMDSDLFCVDTRTVDDNHLWINKNYQDDIKVYSRRDTYDVLLDTRDLDETTWINAFSVDVEGYEKPCVAIVQYAVRLHIVDKKEFTLRPILETHGLVVDADEWEEAFDWVVAKSYHLRKLHYTDKQLSRVKNYVHSKALEAQGKKGEALNLKF